MKSLFEQLLPLLGSQARRWERHFYLVLAVGMGIFLLGDFVLQGTFGARAANADDQLLKWRVSSPRPSSDIVIVDIDERTLERVGRDHGRWPWTRAVLAEAIANVAEAQPKAVFVNVIVAERDLRDPAGDAALAEVAAGYDRIVFPFVRLPAANDTLSQLDAGLIPGARKVDEAAASRSTVAAVLPAFESLQRNMGASNLLADSDGIIRRYEYWLPAGAYSLPSAAASVLGLAGGNSAPGEGKEVKLNWRNKRGDYPRISFAELYEGMNGSKTFDWSRFAGKVVIIGASAPGISVVKPTAVSTMTDDNTILATAIDDGLSDTALRVTSPLIGLALAVLMLAALAGAFLYGIDQGIINRVFATSQSILLIVTFFSVSYSNFIVDLTLPFNIGLAYFAIAKTYYGAQHATERGFERFWDTTRARVADEMILIVMRLDQPGARPPATRIRRLLEREISWDDVLYVDQFVDGRTFLGAGLENIELVLAFLPRGKLVDDLQAVQLARRLGHAVKCLDVEGLDEKQIRALVWREVVGIAFPGK